VITEVDPEPWIILLRSRWPGRLADVALIDGDPARRISDVRRTLVTVKDGVVYRPAELYRELGVRADWPVNAPPPKAPALPARAH
jgi:hypothetical protein